MRYEHSILTHDEMAALHASQEAQAFGEPSRPGCECLMCQRDDAVARTLLLRNAYDQAESQLAAKDREIAELKETIDGLAELNHLLRRAACDGSSPPTGHTPMPVADPTPSIIEDTIAGNAKPKPHDPFNLPQKDHRRMGPE